MTNDPGSVFERNVEALVRGSAQPVEDPGAARRRFLEAASRPVEFFPRGRLGRALSAAAALLAFGGIVWMALPRRDSGAPAVPDAPAPAAQESDPLRLTEGKPPEPESDTASAEPSEGGVTLTLRPPAPRANNPTLTINGRAKVPEGCILQVNVLGSEEALTSQRLIAVPMRYVGAPVPVKSGRFHYRPDFRGPGPYVIQVLLTDHNQTPQMAAAMKGKYSVREWTFPFAVWGDDILGQVGTALDDLDRLLAEAIELAGEYDAKAGTEADWKRDGKTLADKGQKFLARLELIKAGGRTAKLLSASFQELFSTVQALTSNVRNFSWEKGKLQVKTYYDGGQRVKTWKGDPFEFEALRKYLREAAAVAGREAALWVVRDLRRAGRRPPLMDFLKAYGAHPGLVPVAERLRKEDPPDLDVLEKEIRG